MAELCRHYGIARKTGYKILARWQQDGTEGLKDLSRTPHRHPNQTPAEVEEHVLAARHLHMRWGPRKLRSWLEARHPDRSWPAPSTIGELLKRAGLVSRPASAPSHAALHAAVCQVPHRLVRHSESHHRTTAMTHPMSAEIRRSQRPRFPDSHRHDYDEKTIL